MEERPSSEEIKRRKRKTLMEAFSFFITEPRKKGRDTAFTLALQY